MNIIERIARAICDYHGREPDFTAHGEVAWKRYVSEATMIWNVVQKHIREG